jgi:alkylation response protein AidB-like acyl-CoA dehydrogenase
MDLNFTQEEEDFRLEVRNWIAENLPEVFRTAAGGRASKEQRNEYFNKLSPKNWLCASWPEEYGGPGWSLAQQYIFSEESTAAGAPPLGFGPTMIGPLILECGTDEQRKRYLPPIADASEWWCQGYSEPNAGSDLANLALSSVLDGDEYVLNGQKIWTSSAHEADWIFVLGRTNTTLERKQQGITFFLVPMDTPGIELRPIKQISGDSEFYETFFTDVRVPAENIVGEEDMGWTMGKRLLTYERVSTGGAGAYTKNLERLTRLAKRTEINGAPALQDSVTRQKLAELHMDLDALAALGFRGLTNTFKGQMPGPESSCVKLHGTELGQHITDMAQDLQGPELLYFLDENYKDVEDTWPRTACWSRASTIFGGTSEVQRNIIAERVLGLPKG